MRLMIYASLVLQVGYAEKMASVWLKVSEESNPHGKLPESHFPGTPRP